MSKKYIIESAGFRNGIGSTTWSNKNKAKIKHIKNQIKALDMTRNITTIKELHDLIKEVGIYQISFQDIKDRNFISNNNEIYNFNISFELMEFISLEVTNIIGGNKNQKLEVRRELLFNNNLKHKNLDRFILDANQDGTVSVYYEPYNEDSETEEFMELVNYLKRQ